MNSSVDWQLYYPEANGELRQHKVGNFQVMNDAAKRGSAAFCRIHYHRRYWLIPDTNPMTTILITVRAAL